MKKKEKEIMDSYVNKDFEKLYYFFHKRTIRLIPDKKNNLYLRNELLLKAILETILNKNIYNKKNDIYNEIYYFFNLDNLVKQNKQFDNYYLNNYLEIIPLEKNKTTGSSYEQHHYYSNYLYKLILENIEKKYTLNLELYKVITNIKKF